MRRRPPPKRTPQGDYEIGYARPPANTRWAPGQSGNPDGRPKQPRSIGASADKALNSKVSVVDENGRRRSLVAEDVIMRQIRDAALNGDVKATTFLLDRAERYRAAQPVKDHAPELSPEDIEVLETLLDRTAKDKRRTSSASRRRTGRRP